MMLHFPKNEVDETGMSIPERGINKNVTDLRAVIEATNYTPFNPYLNDRQKNICEIFNNLPAITFIFSFIFFSWISLDFLKPVILSIYVSLFFGWLVNVLNEKILSKLINFNFIYEKKFISIGIIFLSFFSGIINWKSGIGLIAIYITGLFVPGTNISNNIVRSKHPRLNPIYGRAKEIFKIDFPFEKYLPDSPSMIKEDIASATGSEIIAWGSLFLLVFATVFFLLN